MLCVLFEALSEYKACIAPTCTDVTVDKSLGTIDPFSLIVKNEYIFIKVRLLNYVLKYSYKWFMPLIKKKIIVLD